MWPWVSTLVDFFCAQKRGETYFRVVFVPKKGVFMKKRMAFGVACVVSVAISSAFTITPDPIVSSGA